MNFNGHCLINSNIFSLKKVINIYISYILSQWPRDLNADYTLDNHLLGSVKLTKNANPDKYAYTGYGIRFDWRPELSLADGCVGKKCYYSWSWYELICAYW